MNMHQFQMCKPLTFCFLRINDAYANIEYIE